jgi:hypothetical protein
VAGELVSSWLLRVAAQNSITLREFLAAVRLAYPSANVELASVDHDLPSEFCAGLAQLCRVSAGTIRKLELQHQFPGVPRQMFLSFPWNRDLITHASDKRARYEFCLNCLNEPFAANSRQRFASSGASHGSPIATSTTGR